MSGKRECACPRVKHQHGTEAAYTEDDCRCFPCSIARHRYTAALRAGEAPERRTATVHGTRRRLQALCALGYSPPELAAHCSLNEQTVMRLRCMGDQRSVLFQTRDDVTRLYDLLWATPSTGPHAKRMRNMAVRNGWLPPMVWDDDEIDDPAAAPHMPKDGSWDLAVCGTAAAARRHYRRGEPLCEACKNASKRDTVERRAKKVAA